MTHRIDTAAQGVERAGAHRPGDRAAGEAKAPELTDRDDAMLARCQVRQPSAPRLRFVPHSGTNLNHTFVSPLAGSGGVPESATELLGRDHAGQFAVGVDGHQGAEAAQVLVRQQRVEGGVVADEEAAVVVDEVGDG
jgi:hypothetical protein